MIFDISTFAYTTSIHYCIWSWQSRIISHAVHSSLRALHHHNLLQVVLIHMYQYLIHLRSMYESNPDRTCSMAEIWCWFLLRVPYCLSSITHIMFQTYKLVCLRCLSHMSHTCLTHVSHMSHTCLTHVSHTLSQLYHSHHVPDLWAGLLEVSHTCLTHVGQN